MKKTNHSKIKNTIILFELLTRQVTADVISGKEPSPALKIIKEFFKPTTQLAKELVLYQTLLKEKYKSNDRAEALVETVLQLRNRVNGATLAKEKYNIIKEIKKNYDLKAFFETNLSDYRVYASIYNLFEGVTFTNPTKIVNARFTIVEHLTRKATQKQSDETQLVVEEYKRQDEEIRLLAYKIMLDKFNEKYTKLGSRQKLILKEYINNISSTKDLRDFIVKESTFLQNKFKSITSQITNRVIKIKVQEAVNLLDRFNKVRVVKEDNVLSLLLYHELLKEVSNATAK
jgi:hypothetical protein